MQKIIGGLLFVFAALSADILGAREPYHARIIVDGESARVSAPNLVDLSRDLKTGAIESLLPIYTPISAASLNINLRGIYAMGSFAANSMVFVVKIPQAGLTETFNGGTRDESIRLFKDYVRDAGRHSRLLKAYARYSPIDPIAGNPDSLQAQMAQSDYLLGRLSPLSGCGCLSWDAQPTVHLVQTGAFYGRAFVEGFDTTTVTLPLRYSYSPDLAWAFIIDAPLTYNRNGGASSAYGSVGVGLRVPMACHWSLTPIVRVGGGGSLDLCTAGTFASFGLNSVLQYDFCGFTAALTDYAGYYTTTNLWLTGVNFNYHLHNWIFKNGISITSCEGLNVCGSVINISFSFVDSYFAREHLFIKHFDEAGVSFIASGVLSCLSDDSLSLGFSYRFGQKSYKGYFVRVDYQF